VTFGLSFGLIANPGETCEEGMVPTLSQLFYNLTITTGILKIPVGQVNSRRPGQKLTDIKSVGPVHQTTSPTVISNSSHADNGWLTLLDDPVVHQTSLMPIN
jgi:hypothetical protein